MIGADWIVAVRRRDRRIFERLGGPCWRCFFANQPQEALNIAGCDTCACWETKEGGESMF